MAERTICCDVLVVGGGGAGFRAAIAAKERGMDVLLLSKGPLARCGASPMAGADFTLDGNSMNKLGFSGDPNDSMEKVFNDIVTQGFYINNQKLVYQYVKRAPTLLKDLLDWGLEIYLNDERFVMTSGLHIMDVLLKKARSIGVKMFEDVMMLDLVVADGRVTGALGFDIRNGEFINFHTKAVVMATGGWHKAFWPNTGMRDLSGEGIAAANRAGARLGNMEFITFCCNVFYYPPKWMGSIAAYVLSCMGGLVTNNKNEDIMKDLDPVIVKVCSSSEWNKCVVSHCSAKEIKAGNGFAHGGVHYRRGDVSWDFIKFVGEAMWPNWKYKALDLSEFGKLLEKNEPVEVGPAVEYFDGGILINERFETDVEGLFAAGECSTGAFGSNRVFSAITEMLVQGLDAGENAAVYADKNALGELDNKYLLELQKQAEIPLANSNGIKPALIRREIQEKAHKYLGPIRSREGLSDFIEYIDTIKKNELRRLGTSSDSRLYNKEWMDALELPNMVQLIETSARCALARTESRGVHYREDYPVSNNDEWIKESTVKYSNDVLNIGLQDVVVTSLKPPCDIIPYFDMVKNMMELHSDTRGHH